MEQLNLYHEMGCPDDVTDHPSYKRWLYRRDVEGSVACGRAPELKSVRFEDEQPVQSQAATGRTVEIKCRKCRLVPQLKIQTHTPKGKRKKEKLPDLLNRITEQNWQQLHSSSRMRKKSKILPSPQQPPIVAMFSSTL